MENSEYLYRALRKKYDEKTISSILVDGKNIIKIINEEIDTCTSLFLFEKITYSNSSFIKTTIRENKTAILIDNTFAQVDYVPGLKTTLYNHQKPIVRAMLEFEFSRVLTKNVVTQDHDYTITFNSAVLSEPVGSGKTIDILSLICLSKIPRVLPDIVPLYIYDYSIAFARKKFKKILKPTIIFVGSSVVEQWKSAIKTFTDLRVFVVSNVFELRDLLKKIENRSINHYDIVLVKNGKITVPISLPDDLELHPVNKNASPYIYNIISNLYDYCWARVVFDDFDTIKLPSNARIVNGLFTWYVSSTRKKIETVRNYSNPLLSTEEELLQNNNSCLSIKNNFPMFYYLNIRNEENFLKSTIQLPNIKYHVKTFNNPNDIFISMLTSMNDVDISRVTEMLNSDAIMTAAETVGVKTNNVGDIFSKILGDKFGKYKFAIDLLEFIEYQQSKEDERLPMNMNDRADDKYGKKDLLQFREIEYKYPGVGKLLTDTEEEYNKIKETNGNAIERVKNNIKSGSCPVCHLDFEDSDEFVIVKCCNKIFCVRCGIDAQNLRNRNLTGRCSNCRSTLTIKDLIFIGSEIDIQNISEENIEETTEEKLVIAAKNTEEENVKTKYDAIIAIIKNIKMDNQRIDMFIPNMMKGTLNLPEVNVRKVLIFTNYDESIKNVTEELTKNSVLYWKLHGTSREIAETAAKFTECTENCALVINSAQHCSGLNLQTATDLIFLHVILDKAVESQVAGRGHRIGRKSPLNIWYLLYKNEYSYLQSERGARLLTEDEITNENHIN